MSQEFNSGDNSATAIRNFVNTAFGSSFRSRTYALVAQGAVPRRAPQCPHSFQTGNDPLPWT